MLRNILKRRISLLNGSWGLSQDQLALRELALGFTKQQIAPHATQWDLTEEFPISTLKQAAQLGFAGLYTSPQYGGSGLSRFEASIVFEALGTGCGSTACYLSIHNMCSWIIDKFASDQQKQKWGPALNSFDLASSYCLSEPGSGSDSAAMRTSAQLDGDHYVLNGSKMFISGGGVSDLYFVMAKTDQKEISCFVVEKGSPGLSYGAKEGGKLGWRNMPTAVVQFDDCRIPKENIIGHPGLGFKIAMQALDGGRVNISSCGLGVAWRALEKTCEYMDQRQQFNTKLKDFQYLRFKTAEAATKLHASRLMLRESAKMLDEGYALKTPFAAMSKFFATEACSEIADFAVQAHGGYGVLSEYEVERMLREIRVLYIVEGTNEIMRLIVSRNIFEPKFQQILTKSLPSDRNSVKMESIIEELTVSFSALDFANIIDAAERLELQPTYQYSPEHVILHILSCIIAKKTFLVPPLWKRLPSNIKNHREVKASRDICKFLLQKEYRQVWQILTSFNWEVGADFIAPLAQYLIESITTLVARGYCSIEETMLQEILGGNYTNQWQRDGNYVKPHYEKPKREVEVTQESMERLSRLIGYLENKYNTE